MLQQKRVLICPLDWGLGHATRCIPIIRILLSKNANVLIAADGATFDLLHLEFPHLEFIRLPGFKPKYGSFIPLSIQILFSLPSFLKSISTENILLKNIVSEKSIDIVISDNRFGCFSEKTFNVFMTHQLFIQATFFQNIIRHENFRRIRNFDECWIPDNDSEQNLSGRLSHKNKTPIPGTYFIGLLSRFNREENKSTDKKYKVMGIVSGPEPQREIFKTILLREFSNLKEPALLVCGEPGKTKEMRETGFVKIINHLNAEEMKQAILNAEMIICRSGYSGLMDLSVLEKKALLVPTPGQTEQEYLARKLKRERIAYSVSQKKLKLPEELEKALNYKGFKHIGNNQILLQRIDSMLFAD